MKVVSYITAVIFVGKASAHDSGEDDATAHQEPTLHQQLEHLQSMEQHAKQKNIELLQEFKSAQHMIDLFFYEVTNLSEELYSVQSNPGVIEKANQLQELQTTNEKMRKALAQYDLRKDFTISSSAETGIATSDAPRPDMQSLHPMVNDFFSAQFPDRDWQKLGLTTSVDSTRSVCADSECSRIENSTCGSEPAADAVKDIIGNRPEVLWDGESLVGMVGNSSAVDPHRNTISSNCSKNLENKQMDWISQNTMEMSKGNSVASTKDYEEDKLDYWQELMNTLRKNDATKAVRFAARLQGDINRTTNGGMTALIASSFKGFDEVVVHLLEYQLVDVNFQKNNGATALFLAAQQGHFTVVQKLVSHRQIDVNIANENESTPLFIASQKGHELVAHALLAHVKINVNQKNKNGSTPLTVAVENGHLSIVQRLLDRQEIDVNHAEDFYGATALMIACQEGHRNIVEALLNRPKIQVNQTRHDTATALYMAAQRGFGDIVQLLLASHGIDVNQADINGAAPLHMAAQHGHVDVVRKLLQHPGIDAFKKDKFDFTPKNLAVQFDNEEIVQEFVAYERREL